MKDNQGTGWTFDQSDRSQPESEEWVEHEISVPCGLWIIVIVLAFFTMVGMAIAVILM